MAKAKFTKDKQTRKTFLVCGKHSTAVLYQPRYPNDPTSCVCTYGFEWEGIEYGYYITQKECKEKFASLFEK